MLGWSRLLHHHANSLRFQVEPTSPQKKSKPDMRCTQEQGKAHVMRANEYIQIDEPLGGFYKYWVST